MQRRHWYLFTYDIRQPKRLQKLHRLLRQHGYALQESWFIIAADGQQRAQLHQQIKRIINASSDDVRSYRLYGNTYIHCWGKLPFAEGIFDSGQPPCRHHTLDDYVL